MQDFIPVRELSRLVSVPLKTLYNASHTGRGPCADILTKLGGRLGCWRLDYEQFVARERRLKDQAA